MLTDKEINTAIDSKVRCLIQYDSENYTNGNLERSCRRVLKSKLYDLIINPDSRLFIEPIDYIFEAYNIEKRQGVDLMMDFISEGQ